MVLGAIVRTVGRVSTKVVQKTPVRTPVRTTITKTIQTPIKNKIQRTNSNNKNPFVSQKPETRKRTVIINKKPIRIKNVRTPKFLYHGTSGINENKLIKSKQFNSKIRRKTGETRPALFGSPNKKLASHFIDTTFTNTKKQINRKPLKIIIKQNPPPRIIASKDLAKITKTRNLMRQGGYFEENENILASQIQFNFAKKNNFDMIRTSRGMSKEFGSTSEDEFLIVNDEIIEKIVPSINKKEKLGNIGRKISGGYSDLFNSYTGKIPIGTNLAFQSQVLGGAIVGLDQFFSNNKMPITNKDIPSYNIGGFKFGGLVKPFIPDF